MGWVVVNMYRQRPAEVHILVPAPAFRLLTFLGTQDAELAGMAHCLPQNYQLGCTQAQMPKPHGLLPATARGIQATWAPPPPSSQLPHLSELCLAPMPIDLSLDSLALCWPKRRPGPPFSQSTSTPAPLGGEPSRLIPLPSKH